MSKFHKGQKILCTKDATLTSGITTASKGLMYVVNATKSKCSCGHRIGVDIGYRAVKPIEHICPTCKDTFESTIHWIGEGFFSAVMEEELQDKRIVELEVIKLLANKQITYDVYQKIMAMCQGDEEMLNLAKLVSDASK